MPTIKLSSPFQSYTQGKLEIPVQGETVAEAVDHLAQQYPSLRSHLFDKEGSLRPFVNLFLSGTHINELQGAATPLGAEDVLRLVPSVAGGGKDGKHDRENGFGPQRRRRQGGF
jgi:molybdopterin synthase sulfur carrier subunit